jgi:glycosyltransferase involved in cell wall biosynthesis
VVKAMTMPSCHPASIPASKIARVGGRRNLILVTSYPGQPSCTEFERQAAAGQRPRKDYVELARLVDADVVDDAYLTERATVLARVVQRVAGRPAAQVVEAALRGGNYDHILAGAERIGLPLAFLHKIAHLDRDLVLIAAWPSRAGKAFMLKRLQVHTDLRAIVGYSSAQLEIAASRLTVPRNKLQLLLQPVDERFFQPSPATATNLICAVGSTGRDYETLLSAVRGLEVELRIAVGSFDLADRALERRLVRTGLPPNTKIRHLSPLELRDLYSSARFVVLPLEDVESDCGVTALTEAMAMSKAVILTRTRGQIDVIEDGVQGMYVPARDPQALRAAIEFLLAHPEEADRMGRAGRALAEERHTLTGFVERLAATLRGEPIVPAGANDRLRPAASSIRA